MVWINEFNRDFIFGNLGCFKFYNIKHSHAMTEVTRWTQAWLPCSDQFPAEDYWLKGCMYNHMAFEFFQSFCLSFSFLSSLKSQRELCIYFLVSAAWHWNCWSWDSWVGLFIIYFWFLAEISQQFYNKIWLLKLFDSYWAIRLSHLKKKIWLLSPLYILL